MPAPPAFDPNYTFRDFGPIRLKPKVAYDNGDKIQKQSGKYTPPVVETELDVTTARPEKPRPRRLERQQLSPTDWARAVFEETGNVDFIAIGQACKDLMDKDPEFAGLKVKLSNRNLHEGGLRYLFANAYAAGERMPRDKHIAREVQNCIRRIPREA
jgi:hypothetical protein